MTTTQTNMTNTFTDTFDWLNEGNVTVYDYLSMINITPLSITEEEGTNFP